MKILAVFGNICTFRPLIFKTFQSLLIWHSRVDFDQHILRIRKAITWMSSWWNFCKTHKISAIIMSFKILLQILCILCTLKKFTSDSSTLTFKNKASRVPKIPEFVKYLSQFCAQIWVTMVSLQEYSLLHHLKIESFKYVQKIR